MRVGRCLVILILSLVQQARAQSDPAGNLLLEEILVHGRRASLAELRQEMIRLEDQFYERYNALNADDLYDIHCAERAPTGSRIRRRYCRTGYEERALEAEGRAHLRALQHQSQGLMNMMGGTPGPGGTVSMGVGGDPATTGAMEWIAPSPSGVDFARHHQVLRATMLEITTNHPELVELLRQRLLLFERYEEQRRKRFGLAAPAEE